jgi:hypothetical protein
MKKIIRQGVQRYHANCSECGATFSYEREDVHHNYARGGDYVSCPCCGHSCSHFGASGTRWPDCERPRIWPPYRCTWQMDAVRDGSWAR